MADVTITFTEVAKSTGATVFEGIYGDSVTGAAGQPVYLKAADNRLWRADADALATAAAQGILLNSAAAGQPCDVQTGGTIDLGASCDMVKGKTYVVSTTTGGIAPQADLGSGDYVTVLGIALSTRLLKLQIKASGVAIP